MYLVLPKFFNGKLNFKTIAKSAMLQTYDDNIHEIDFSFKVAMF